MEESRWHFVLRLPAPANGSSVESMTRLLRFDGGGGGVSCLAWGVGIDCWTVFSTLRGGGGGVWGLWNCWVSRHMIRREFPASG